ncbi:MAG: hypothetical protein NW237_05360 [Cyanobacteriota bacterium]|nr:hypothetical protein [Cyanobacteriota bacterium]
MHIPSGSLRSGIEALKQERYLEAINLLEAFCYCCHLPDHAEEASSEDCLLAGVSLVAAYERSGDLERATALCQEMAAGSPSWAQTWATQALAVLSHPQPKSALPWQQDQSHQLPPIQHKAYDCQSVPLHDSILALCKSA